MTAALMHEWRQNVWEVRKTAFHRMKESVLIMDSFSAHTEPSVLASFEQNNTKCLVVPASMTAVLAEVVTLL